MCTKKYFLAIYLILNMSLTAYSIPKPTTFDDRCFGCEYILYTGPSVLYCDPNLNKNKIYLDNYFKNQFELKVSYNKINNKYYNYQVFSPYDNEIMGMYILDLNQKVIGYILLEAYAMGELKRNNENYNSLMNPILSLSQNDLYTSNVKNLGDFKLDTYENKEDNYTERFIILNKITNLNPNGDYLQPLLILQSFYPDDLEEYVTVIINNHLQDTVNFFNTPK